MPPINKPKCLYIGIDPGASGGLASVLSCGSVVIESMPPTEQDVWEWFRSQRSFGPSITTFACIEQVGGFIAGNASPGSAMFKFGMSYGSLRMALVAAEIPFEAVTPQRWQKALGVVKRARDESKSDFKNRLKARAQQLFPREKITLATADALLIAEYCRRFREGTLR
jgi:hypothetical protein